MKLKGLSLFSGIGGIDLALSDYVKPIAYCEIDKYAQAVLLSRMSEGTLPRVPIIKDVKTINMETFGSRRVDIIYGGFP